MKDTNISVSEFVLSCLKETDPKDGIGVIFILIYLVTIFGNVTVILIVVMDQQLQRPMYMCIVILSVIDVTCSTTIIMKILVALLFKNTVIPRNACYVQMLVLQYMQALEIFLLTLMAYDRYVAVNNPLRYSSVITNKTILAIVVILNAVGIMLVSILSFIVTNFNFCSTNILPYCFCDFTAILSIACFEDARFDILTSSFSALFILFTLFIILFSYSRIIRTALKKSSMDTKRKVISTCLTHLSIVGLFYLTIFFSYVIAAGTRSSSSTVTSSMIIISTVIPPMVNPLIYTFRNKEIKQCILKVIMKKKGATLNFHY